MGKHSAEVEAELAWWHASGREAGARLVMSMLRNRAGYEFGVGNDEQATQLRLLANAASELVGTEELEVERLHDILRASRTG